MKISGHSVFSHDALGGDRELAKNRGGLSGRSFLSIEELDEKVETLSIILTPVWMPAYIAKMERRLKDD
jgi:hypothetical protein